MYLLWLFSVGLAYLYINMKDTYHSTMCFFTNAFVVIDTLALLPFFPVFANYEFLLAALLLA